MSVWEGDGNMGAGQVRPGWAYRRDGQLYSRWWLRNPERTLERRGGKPGNLEGIKKPSQRERES